MSTAPKPIKIDAPLELAVKPEAWRKEICSCTTCDSAGCFAIRYHSPLGCACQKCSHSKTCLFYKNLKANLKIETPMILTELAAKINQAEKDKKQEIDIEKDKENASEKDTTTCAHTKHKNKCRACKCKPQASKDSALITDVAEIKTKKIDSTCEIADCCVKIKDTSKCKNCDCSLKCKYRPNAKTKACLSFSSGVNSPADLMCDFPEPTIKVKRTDKCKICKCAEKCSQNIFTKKGEPQVVSEQPSEQKDKVYVINECSEPATVAVEYKSIKNTVKNNEISQVSSVKEDIQNHLKIFSEPVIIRVKDTSKCKNCECPPADNICEHDTRKTNAQVVDAKNAKYTEVCDKCMNDDKSLKCQSNDIGGLKKSFKDCQCKSFFKSDLLANEAREARPYILENTKCKTCFSKHRKDRLPTQSTVDEEKVQRKCTQSKSCTTKAAADAKPQKGCEVCKCKSIYACMYNAKETWISPKVSLDSKKCRKCKPKLSKENCCRMNLSKESLQILDSVAGKCHKKNKIKDYRQCCNAVEKHDTNKVTSLELKGDQDRFSETETRTNILEKVRKFLADKIAGHTTAVPAASTADSQQKIKEQTQNEMVIDGKDTTTDASRSNMAINSEPSIINIVKKYISDKFTAKSTSTQEVTKTQNEPGTDNIGFVNKIVITTTLGSKDGSKSLQDNSDNVGNEIVYEFVRNKNPKNCRRQNMCVQHTQETKNRKEDTSAKLSAQVMDVPYKEYQNTVKRSGTHKDQSYDVFEKIREIYNTCTCKICECIANLAPAITSEVCKCKPCHCDTCTAYKNVQPPTRKHVLSSCRCKPCECIDCKLIGTNKQRNFIVAPVGESTNRTICGCTPCGCFECGQPFNTISRTPVTHEMATGVNRHMNCNCETCTNDLCEQEGADTCNCDRHSKVMRKPVQNDTNDYDLRHCTVERSSKKRKHSARNKHKHTDTIAMFASIPNTLMGGNTNSKHYNYAYKDLEANAIKLSQEFRPWKKPKESSRTCDCRPCECSKCIKHYYEGHDPTTHCSNRWCEICECISSENSKLNNKLYSDESKDICNCKPCDCFDCRKYNIRCKSSENENCCMAKRSHESGSSLNKIDSFYLPLINASDSERYLDLLLKEKENQNRPVPKKSFDQKNNPEKMQLFHAVTQNIENIDYMTKKRDEIYQTHSHECPYGTNKENNVFEETTTSDESSEVSTEKPEHECCNSLTEKVPTQSQESSCNSSGHDYSDYLIRFPRSTVETCIKDVMNLNIHRKIDLVNYIKSSLKKSETTISETDRSYNRISFKGRQSFENEGVFKNSAHHQKGSISESNSKSSKLRKCSCICDDCSCSGSCLNEDIILKNEKIQAGSNVIEKEQFVWDSYCNKTSKASTPSRIINASRDTQDTYLSNDTDTMLFKKSNVTFSDKDTSLCQHKNESINKNQDSIPKHDTSKASNNLVEGEEYVWNSKYNNSKISASARINTPRDSPGTNTTHDKERITIKKSNVTFNDKNVSLYSPRCGSIVNNPIITSGPEMYINYNSVQKTLRNAKAFSHELLNILSKYEKANKEFNSVTKRFEGLHSSIFSKNIMKSEIIEEITHNQNESNERPICKAPSDICEKVNYRTDYQLTVPYVEMSTGPEDRYSKSDLLINQYKTIEYGISSSSTEYHRKESQITKSHNEWTEGFENDKTESVLTTNPQDEQSTEYHRPESMFTEQPTEVNFGFEYGLPKSVLGTRTSSRNNRTESTLIEPRVEINTNTGECSHNPCNKLIEIISQAGCKDLIKPMVERISITSSLLINDLPETTPSVKAEQETLGTLAKNESINRLKLVSTDIDAILEKPALEKDDCKQHKDEKITKVDLKALKNKYQMYSEHISHGILKCRRDVWKRSSNTTSITLTESQITLSRLNIGIMDVNSEKTKEIREESSRKHTNRLKTVFINSSDTISDAPYLRIEEEMKIAGNKKLFVEKGYEASWKRTQEKDKPIESGGVSIDKNYFGPQAYKISVCKGHYNMNEPSNEPSTSQDNYIKAELRPRFESMPAMASTAMSAMKTLIAPQIASIFATDSIYDPKKISFQTVRKVSDHTVVVKWKVPPDMKDVVGYEVLIDGRPAQNILNPHRNMAVVTCLPHSDKVLLTVRTITSKTSACGRHPSTSIVYRPLVK